MPEAAANEHDQSLEKAAQDLISHYGADIQASWIERYGEKQTFQMRTALVAICQIRQARERQIDAWILNAFYGNKNHWIKQVETAAIDETPYPTNS